MKWYQAVTGGPRPSIKMAQNGFGVVELRNLRSNCTDTFVFLDQCNQIFYHPIHGDQNWLYVIDVAPCSTRDFDNANILTPINETNISFGMLDESGNVLS